MMKIIRNQQRNKIRKKHMRKEKLKKKILNNVEVEKNIQEGNEMP
jgi:hypothetical protein